ncbi:MAG TPA: DUF4184 family protein [Polyangia bacterium]|jgi:hypothetical protein|nr:DUF4184 family protein [Polyangia bacterium]
MPFTASHVIAAVPLRRLLARRAVTSALVIGTMVPDFRHFIPVIPGHAHLPTHFVSALLWFALPVGLVTYFVFERLLRAPAVALLPVFVRQRLGARLAPPTPAEEPPLADVALSLIAGAASHIAWDAFTHRGTFIVDAFPGFFYRVFYRRGTWELFGYGILQHASSLAGLALLLAWWRRWLARQPVDSTIGAGATAGERRVALLVTLVAPAIALVAELVFLTAHVGLLKRKAVPLSVSAAGIVLTIGGVAYATVWHRRRRHEPP